MFGKNLVVQLWCKTLPTNQIAVFFDHQYLWKYSIDTLDFLHGDNHKQKEGFEITTLVGCGQLCLSFSQIVGFFHHQYFWKESANNVHFCIM